MKDFSVTVSLSKQLSFNEVVYLFILQLYRDTVLNYSNKKSTQNENNTKISCERGSKGAKQFISAISMLDLFYLPDFKYKFSTVKDISQYRYLREFRPNISSILSIPES
jgi:hypothetical protein